MEPEKRNLYKAALGLVIVLTLFFAIKFLAELRAYGGVRNGEVNTISVSGHGEVQAVPDIASVYFTIRQEGKTVKEAQEKAAVIEKKALDFLRANNIADKDIRTESASFNPKYEYVYDTKILMPCTEFNCPPRPGKNMITGYEAYESLTVKIRNTDDAGKIIEGLGALGITDLNGPNFTIDDEDNLKREARKKAIDEAKEKAKILAKDLGVRLGRVASFSESGNYPIPIYGKAMMLEAGGGVDVSAPAELPVGENTIISDVTITYEIR